MADAIVLRLDDREVRRNLKHLSDVQAPRAMAEGINKTAFEVAAAEKAEVRSVFEFAGSTTERFLSGKGSIVSKRSSVVDRPSSADPPVSENRAS